MMTRSERSAQTIIKIHNNKIYKFEYNNDIFEVLYKKINKNII